MLPNQIGFVQCTASQNTSQDTGLQPPLLPLSASVVSDSVRPHRRQPPRLPRPWDSPGKNTGVGCHFLLRCMKVKSESEVAQSYLTLCNPMDCSPPGSSVHDIFQARVGWGAIAFSGGLQQRGFIPEVKETGELVSSLLP